MEKYDKKGGENIMTVENRIEEALRGMMEDPELSQVITDINPIPTHIMNPWLGVIDNQGVEKGHERALSKLQDALNR